MTNKEKLIENARNQRVALEVEKMKFIKEIWKLESQIEKINELLKKHGQGKILEE